jgi:hypothetical protein
MGRLQATGTRRVPRPRAGHSAIWWLSRWPVVLHRWGLGGLERLRCRLGDAGPGLDAALLQPWPMAGIVISAGVVYAGPQARHQAQPG